MSSPSLVGTRFAVGAIVALFVAALPRPAAATSFTFSQVIFPGMSETDATGINDAGQVVGFVFNTAGNSDGFVDTVWDRPVSCGGFVVAARLAERAHTATIVCPRSLAATSVGWN